MVALPQSHLLAFSVGLDSQRGGQVGKDIPTPHLHTLHTAQHTEIDGTVADTRRTQTPCDTRWRQYGLNTV